MQTFQKRLGGWGAKAEIVTILIGAAALVVSLVIVLAHGGMPTQGGGVRALLLLIPTVAIAVLIVSYRHLRRAKMSVQSEEEIEKKADDKVEKKMEKWLG